jgi:hypothetical protein
MGYWFFFPNFGLGFINQYKVDTTPVSIIQIICTPLKSIIKIFVKKKKEHYKNVSITNVLQNVQHSDTYYSILNREIQSITNVLLRLSLLSRPLNRSLYLSIFELFN